MGKEYFPKLSGVLGFFEEFSKIPRGSSNTAPIADYLVGFAKERGLDYYRDKADNVIIRKGATAGYEDRPAVILQGHTDMVPEKRSDVDIDMESEGVRLVYDGDYLRADGTTLGADDGIAMAYALAILDSDSIKHPAIEAVFTSDEEIGLLGATALDKSVIRGRLMINIDSDEEGVFTVGCAGGVRVDVELPVKYEAASGNAYRLTLSGLAGGHSGIEIDRGRENAIKIMGELLSAIPEARVAEITGGNADNAIPRECSATVAVSSGLERAALEKIIEGYRTREPGIALAIEECDAERMLDGESSSKLIALIGELPSGVIAMSEDIPGLVETSLNMGITRLDDVFSVSFSVRSAKGAAKAALVERLKSIAEAKGARFSTRGAYPAWEYRKESHLRDVMCEVYERLYGKAAKVVTIHAGLECGIFSDAIEGLDCVSIGPDNKDIHTPEERLSLPSSERVFEYLLEVLANV